MPIIEVWGVAKHPMGQGLRQLTALTEKVRGAVVSVSELMLEEKHVSVFYPADYRNDTEFRDSSTLQKHGFAIGSVDDTIVVFVRGLFVAAERTADVRTKLAEKIAACLKETAKSQKATQIEVFVEVFSKNVGGFASVSVPLDSTQAAE